MIELKVVKMTTLVNIRSFCVRKQAKCGHNLTQTLINRSFIKYPSIGHIGRFLDLKCTKPSPNTRNRPYNYNKRVYYETLAVWAHSETPITGYQGNIFCRAYQHANRRTWPGNRSLPWSYSPGNPYRSDGVCGHSLRSWSPAGWQFPWNLYSGQWVGVFSGNLRES